MTIELSHRPVLTFKPQSIIDQFAHDIYLTHIHKTYPMTEVHVTKLVWEQLKLELKEKMEFVPTYTYPNPTEVGSTILFGVRIVVESK